ncbi:MAG: GNAT family N-acetyltransferase [Acidobacteriota bacterium]|nr:MAG: GNAT family N-acetyltransferase [Acidobacteriota bacterium]
MKVRLAEKTDARHFVDFNCAMAMETENKQLDRDTVTRAVEDVFDDPQKGFYIVAEDGDEVLGGLMITYEWSDWRGGWWWWIQSVFIVPEARGRKIYTQLYDFVKERARESGDVYGIRLYVDLDNENAQRVYEKLGMERSHYYMYEESL